jgi:hypothetical protein
LLPDRVNSVSSIAMVVADPAGSNRTTNRSAKHRFLGELREFLTCLFVTAATFSRREQFGEPRCRSQARRSAQVSFGLGVAALSLARSVIMP